MPTCTETLQKHFRITKLKKKGGDSILVYTVHACTIQAITYYVLINDQMKTPKTYNAYNNIHSMTYNMHSTTYNMHSTTYSTTCIAWHTTCIAQRTTCIAQHTTCIAQHTTCIAWHIITATASVVAADTIYNCTKTMYI